MKKNILFILLLFSFCTAFAQEKKETSSPEIFVNAELTLKSYTHFPEIDFLGNVGGSINFESVFIDSYFCFESQMLDSYGSVSYRPLITKHFDAGVEGIIHTEHKFNSYFDIDALIGLSFSYQPMKKFVIDTSVFYFRKSSDLLLDQKTNKWLFTNSLACTLDFYYPFTDSFSAGFEISSFNKTKFDSFITPIFTIYSNYNITDELKISLQVQSVYIDMFTLSGNMNHFAVSTGLEWRLK